VRDNIIVLATFPGDHPALSFTVKKKELQIGARMGLGSKLSIIVVLFRNTCTILARFSVVNLEGVRGEADHECYYTLLSQKLM